MPRVAIQLKCEPKVMQELERLSRSRTDEARLVESAKTILACLSGKQNDVIAVEHKTQPITVGVWRKRFAAEGLAGLHDKVRSGKPPKYQAAELKQRIIVKLEESPPAGLATWDGGSLAQELNVSDDAVWRILRKEGIQLRRHPAHGVSAQILNLP